MSQNQPTKDSNNPVNLLDTMTPQERAQMQAREAAREQRNADLITSEWLALSELGFYYGWPAIQAVLDDVIKLEQAEMFVTGARKVHSSHVYDQAIAALASRTQAPNGFNNLLKKYTDDMEAVN